MFLGSCSTSKLPRQTAAAQDTFLPCIAFPENADSLQVLTPSVSGIYNYPRTRRALAAQKPPPTHDTAQRRGPRNGAGANSGRPVERCGDIPPRFLAPLLARLPVSPPTHALDFEEGAPWRYKCPRRSTSSEIEARLRTGGAFTSSLSRDPATASTPGFWLGENRRGGASRTTRGRSAGSDVL